MKDLGSFGQRTKGGRKASTALVGSALSFVVSIGACFVAVPAGAAPTATVPPESYAATVCSAIAASHAENLAVSASVQQAFDAYKSQPSEATATQVRQGIVSVVEQTGRSMIAIMTIAKGAGIPKMKHGAQFADAVVNQMEAAIAEIGPLTKQASAIDVTTSAKFSSTFQQFSNRLEAVNTAGIKNARKVPAFKNAVAPLRPLVSFMTTHATTCLESNA